MAKLKKIKVLSLAKLQTVIMTIAGSICGILYSIGGLIIDTLVTIGWLSPISMETPGLSIGTLLAFGALIGMPLIFAVTGFLMGLIGAILYNIVAPWFDGFDLGLMSINK